MAFSSGYKSSKKYDRWSAAIAENYGGDHTLEYFYADKKAKELWTFFKEEEGLKDMAASTQAWRQVLGESEIYAAEQGRAPINESKADAKDPLRIENLDLTKMCLNKSRLWLLGALGSTSPKTEILKHCPDALTRTLFNLACDADTRQQVIFDCLKNAKTEEPKQEDLVTEEEPESIDAQTFLPKGAG